MRRRAVAACAAVAGLVVALLAGLVPGLAAGQHGHAAASTVRAVAGSTARVSSSPQAPVLAHLVRAERDSGAGPGTPAARPPSAGPAAPAATPPGRSAIFASDGPGRAVLCVDGRAPPAALPFAVPLSLG